MVMTIGGTAPLKLGAGVKVQLPFAATLGAHAADDGGAAGREAVAAEAEGGHGERGPVDVVVVAEHVAGGEAVFGERGAVGSATGASLTGSTVTTALAGAEVPPWSSVRVKTIVTLPLKSWLGTNTRLAAWAGVSALPAVTGVMPSAR